uniref:Uncharacterized protein n=1 Tax=Chlamydomonas leiostraca TaxID=1034604 RepID=A0A7S0RV37_9CHLO
MMRSHFCGRLAQVLDPGAWEAVCDDVLPALLPHPVPGVSRVRMWMYNGGQGIAGMHVEDCYLSFINAMLWLTLDLSAVATWTKATHAVDGSLAVRAMKLAMRLGRTKTWIFAPSREAAGIIACDAQLAQLQGEAPGGDWLLMRRDMLVQQQWARDNGWHVVTQHPGQLLLSAHMSVVSGAWNVARTSELSRYVSNELAMADHLRDEKNRQAWPKLLTKEARRALAISGAVLHAHLAVCRHPGTTTLLPPGMPVTHEAAAQHLREAAQLVFSHAVSGKVHRLLRVLDHWEAGSLAQLDPHQATCTTCKGPLAVHCYTLRSRRSAMCGWCARASDDQAHLAAVQLASEDECRAAGLVAP